MSGVLPWLGRVTQEVELREKLAEIQLVADGCSYIEQKYRVTCWGKH